MNLYKGYIKTKGKIPVEPFKGRTDFKTYKDVKNCDEFAGVLADDIILIDIDDFDQSEILMDIVEQRKIDCVSYVTTRGRHFLFRNPGMVTQCATGKKLACGLTADIKIGSNNSIQILKFDGEEREKDWDSEELCDLPKWLLPVNSSVDFFGMKDGDGRDSALYAYILTLTAAGFGKDESRECIKIINDYILADKLTDDDIERITRDDAFPKELFYQGKSFLHNNFAEFVKNNDHVKRINGFLHVYQDGFYTGGTREIEGIMIKHLPFLKAAQRTEVLKYLEIICPENEEVADARYIAFNNGILNIETDELIPFSPNIVITNKIPWDYDANAYSDMADRMLNKLSCGDAAIRNLLEEAIGYSFYRRNEMSKAFFLTGDGANGKSTFLDIVNHIVGENNKSSLGLEELDERFSIATLGGKLINTGDDISDDFLQGKAISNFKKLVSGNEVKAEFKGQDAFFMKVYTKFFFSANSLPRTKSKGFSALMRRLVIIPFNARFSPSDADYEPFIGEKIRSDEESMKYLVALGVRGLKRVLSAKDFTKSDKVEEEIKEYEQENNPILGFLEDKDDSEIINRTTTDVHKEYRMYCTEQGYMEMSLKAFSQELNKRRGIIVKRTRINGKLTGIYTKG